MKEINKLLKEVETYYKNKGRSHLPWRKTKDPYKILMSEIMLQQTQASRVIPFYTNFLTQFPTAKALAKAPLSKVLKAWQGLGYNRRAKYLQEASRRLSGTKTFLSGEMNGSPTPARKVLVPLSVEFLESLPGVGPYTARAVSVFTYNRPEVFVETNVRTVFFHSGILKNSRVADKEILPLVEKALKKSKLNPRDFYAALMDYGSYLKGQGVKLNSKSKHYVKQSKFKGSTRELRGAILRELLKGPRTLSQLVKNLSRKSEEVELQLTKLVEEGMVRLYANKSNRASYSVSK